MNFSAYDSAGRRKYLSLAEGGRFVERTRILPRKEELYCRALYLTGCRASELLILTLEEIDFEENCLRIRTLKKREKLITRRIPIPRTLVADLKEIAADDGLLWRFSRTSAWRDVKAVMLVAEIYGPQACPRGLRHGFGVRAALAGVPVTTIKKWMGHSKVETTAIYLDVKDTEERELMSKTWSITED